MSVWVVILLCFVQLTMGGAVGMGLIFMASAESEYSVSDFANNVLVALWFVYGMSLFVSIGAVVYGLIKGASSTSYLWFAMPWAIFIIMIVYWKLSLVKIT